VKQVKRVVVEWMGKEGIGKEGVRRPAVNSLQKDPRFRPLAARCFVNRAEWGAERERAGRGSRPGTSGHGRREEARARARVGWAVNPARLPTSFRRSASPATPSRPSGAGHSALHARWQRRQSLRAHLSRVSLEIERGVPGGVPDFTNC